MVECCFKGNSSLINISDKSNIIKKALFHFPRTYYSSISFFQLGAKLLNSKESPSEQSS
jgi:hypothetical protein